MSTTTLPDRALTTLGALKEELGLSCEALGNPSDAQLVRAILAASQMIERALGRPLHRTQRVEQATSYASARLLLKVQPVISVEEVLDLISDGVVPPECYRIDADTASLLRTDGRYWPKVASYVSQISELRLIAGSEQPSHRVTYTAGWVTPIQALRDSELERDLPHDIEAVCLMIAASQVYRAGRDVSVKSERLMDASIVYATPDESATRAALGDLVVQYGRVIG